MIWLAKTPNNFTFKLPQQEQGVSILESSSSSWHILHSTSFLGDDIFSNSIFVSLAVEAADCINRFLLSIAASNVDSVSNRSTSNTKWSPILKVSEPNTQQALQFLQGSLFKQGVLLQVWFLGNQKKENR